MNGFLMVGYMLVGVGFMFGINMIFGESIEDRVQQFIGEDRVTHEYEPINIKYWSFSNKDWVHRTIDGNAGWSETERNSSLHIIILQNERIIELLENQK